MKVVELYQLISPFAYLVFAISFLLISRTRPEIRSAHWFAVTFFFAACGFMLSFFRGHFALWMLVVLSAAFNYLATFCTATGLVKLTKKSVPLIPLSLGVVAAVLSIVVFQLVVPDQWAAHTTMNTVSAIVILAACGFAWTHHAPRAEKAVLILFGIFGLSFLFRTGMFLWFGSIEAIVSSPLNMGIEQGQLLVHSLIPMAGAFVALFAYGKRLLKLLRTDANTDPLTGLFNRRAFYARIEKLSNKLAGGKDEMFIVLADMDEFKSVNDTYGHAVGDTLLKKVAEIFLDHCDQQRIAARIGGEEFVFALPARSIIDASDLANALRLNIQNTVFETGKGTASFTISLGIAMHAHGTPILETLSRADEALYLAKDAGRNCVMTEADVAIANLKQKAAPSNKEAVQSHVPHPSLGIR